jgi:hypothetical protein
MDDHTQARERMAAEIVAAAQAVAERASSIAQRRFGEGPPEPHAVVDAQERARRGGVFARARERLAQIELTE